MVDKQLRAELEAAYKPAWDLAMSLGQIRLSIRTMEYLSSRGAETLADKLLDTYRYTVDLLEAATSLASDRLLDALDRVHSYPVEIDDYYGDSALEVVLQVAHHDALHFVWAVDLDAYLEIPVTWERYSGWPRFSISQVTEAQEKLTREFQNPGFSVRGPLAAAHVYKEFSRAIGNDVRLVRLKSDRLNNVSDSASGAYQALRRLCDADNGNRWFTRSEWAKAAKMGERSITRFAEELGEEDLIRTGPNGRGYRAK